MSGRLTITPSGPFSLRAAASFGFGPNEGRSAAFDGAMRLAFALDGGEGHAGVVVRQAHEDGALDVELHGDGEAAVVERQLARVLSLDHDGAAFLEAGRRDPVIGELQRAHPGQRPVLFHSPYEAAAWAVVSARRPAVQASRTRQGLADTLGRRFELAGRTLSAFPQPAQLLAAPPGALAGLDSERAERLLGVAAAALDGRLDVERLHALGPQEAWSAVQELRGIGPFYATLVVLRGSGFADAELPLAEPRVLAHIARFYGLAAPPTLEQLATIAAPWRPFRTWTTVLVRLAGDRRFGRAAATRR